MRNHPQYNHRRNGLITPPIVDARMVQSKFNAAKERPCSYKSHSFPFLMMILRTSPAQLNSRLKNMKENSNKTLIFCSMLIEKDLKYCKMTIDYIYSQSMVKMVFTKKHFIIKRIKTNKIFVFVGETAVSELQVLLSTLPQPSYQCLSEQRPLVDKTCSCSFHEFCTSILHLSSLSAF